MKARMVFALIALGIGASASAQTPAAPPAAESPVRSERGYALARLLNSEAITRRQLPGLASQLGAQFRANPDVAPIEKEYPGAVDYLIAALVPGLEQMVMAKAPELWSELGAIYAGAMTETELDATITFYRSPTGTKLIDALVENMDYSPVLEDVAKNDYEGKITAESFEKMVTKTASVAVPKAMSARDRIALMAFSRTPAFAKLTGLRTRTAQAVAEFSNRPDPAYEKRVETISVAALEEFMSAKDGKRAPKPAAVLAAELR